MFYIQILDTYNHLLSDLYEHTEYEYKFQNLLLPNCIASKAEKKRKNRIEKGFLES